MSPVVTRRAAIAASLAGAAFAPSAAFAAKPPVFSDSRGLALRGFDPVAYFTRQAPMQGAAEHAAVHQGATWRFASAANKARFEANPAAYAPQFGGYCAWAVSRNYTASTDPDAWHIENGRLYLNYSLSVRRSWRRDIPGNIAKAERNWPSVLSR